MSIQRYSVTQHPVDTILTWIKSGEIAIPEIQRPFVWDATKVRNLLDSLFAGYPIGYLIAWRNPAIRLKDGTLSAGKRILIDGQQRVTALMAALLGYEVVTKDYRKVKMRIAFHPIERRFEVTNPAIAKDKVWIHDVAELFRPEASLFKITKAYAKANEGIDEDEVFSVIEQLRKMVNNPVGIIDLEESLDIETVTEIFIRVNSAGVSLSQADFAMSKIAANETYGGNILRKAIDYFCHMSTAPEFHSHIRSHDPGFASSDYFQKMGWIKDVNDGVYEPSYTDMLRVAFTSQFPRGRLQDLVALLSGRNFETRAYEETIAEESFDRLRQGVLAFISKTNYERLVMTLRSAGFISGDLIRSQNAVNFAFVCFLHGRRMGVDAANLERLVRRWYVMSVLTGRYSANPESQFDVDIRQIHSQGLERYADAVFTANLSDGFWTAMLPQQLDTSAANSPAFLVFKAAQAQANDKAFLSRDIRVADLILNRGDAHHIYPKNYLRSRGMKWGRYNQVANFAMTQTEINIAISDSSPHKYFVELYEQCNGGPKKYGGITDLDQMLENFRINCIPESVLFGTIPGYDDFLLLRRQLIAQRIRNYFESL